MKSVIVLNAKGQLVLSPPQPRSHPMSLIVSDPEDDAFARYTEQLNKAFDETPVEDRVALIGRYSLNLSAQRLASMASMLAKPDDPFDLLR